jgi:hypothetical protein
MIELIAAAGFTAPTWTPYTFGIAGPLPRHQAVIPCKHPVRTL